MSGVLISAEALAHLGQELFLKLGLSEFDAKYSADVLLQADLRGIPSHGFGRLRRYVAGIQTGQMRIDASARVLRETPMSLVLDADGGMGAPISVDTMQKIIGKAAQTGAAFGCISNSNHFGIAGYYAMMALEHNMIGIAMTNTAALGIPSFGRQVMFGPIRWLLPRLPGARRLLCWICPQR